MPRNPRTFKAVAGLVDSANQSMAERSADLAAWNANQMALFCEAQRQLCACYCRLTFPLRVFAEHELAVEDAKGRDGKRSNHFSVETLRDILTWCSELDEARDTERFPKLVSEKAEELFARAGYRALARIGSEAIAPRAPKNSKNAITEARSKSPIPRTEQLGELRSISRLIAELESQRISIAKKNQPLVFDLLYKLVLPSGVHADDLHSVGLEGLHEGIDRFDPTRGTQLGAAIGAWITYSAKREIGKLKSVVQVPEAMAQLLSKVQRHLHAYPESTHDEIATALKVSAQKVKEALDLPTVVSMAAKSADAEEGGGLEDTLAAPGSSSVAILSEIDRSEVFAAIDEVLNGLSAIDRAIVALSYGLPEGRESAESVLNKLVQISKAIEERPPTGEDGKPVRLPKQTIYVYRQPSK